MDDTYRIGAFSFRILCREKIPLPQNLTLFQVDTGKADYTYQIKISDHFPECAGTVLAQRQDLTVLQTGTGERRLIGITGGSGYYACYQEKGSEQAEITVVPGCLRLLDSDTIFNSLLALERRMINRDSLVLHCSYTRYQEEAILFSAPSETGKSTQSNLWEQYRGAETINGDRGLLRCVDGRWMAEGWPVCGSSGICHNIATPIRAIVMLSQDKENHVARLSGLNAFRPLFSQVTINRWNSVFVQNAIQLLENLCASVPIYHLGCNISEEAVSCLEQVLY